MDPAHRDADYVTRCTTAACELIDEYLGYYVVDVDTGGLVIVLPAPPYPDRLWRAAIGASTDIYRFKDREADTTGTWQNNAAPAPRIPNDPLERYRSLLDPSKHAWGIA